MTMGQALAKKEVQEGIRLYQEQKHEAAIRKWRRALHRIHNRTQKFLTLGYLAAAHGDFGRYRDMLAYAVMQIEIANEAENPVMRVEAYLNLARSNERLCEYHKAVSYSRHCLQSKPSDIRTYGYVYLTQGNAYFGFSNFTRALEMLEYAVRIAKKCKDQELELQIYIALGHVFLQLKDYDKGLKFHLKAMESAKGFEESDPRSKFQRIAYLNLGLAYQKLGRPDQALECAETALKMALEDGDRPVQARCICCLANSYRAKNDFQHASEQYEKAVSIVVEIGDRLGQIEVLVGMAKSMELMKDDQQICECKALEYNKKALEIATCIGNKMHMLRCHRRMEGLYRCLGDEALEEEQSTRCVQLINEMELHCAVCDLDIGEVADTLELYSCFHIAHARCVKHTSKHGLESTGNLGYCPKCIVHKSKKQMGNNHSPNLHHQATVSVESLPHNQIAPELDCSQTIGLQNKDIHKKKQHYNQNLPHNNISESSHHLTTQSTSYDHHQMAYQLHQQLPMNHKESHQSPGHLPVLQSDAQKCCEQVPCVHTLEMDDTLPDPPDFIKQERSPKEHLPLLQRQFSMHTEQHPQHEELPLLPPQCEPHNHQSDMTQMKLTSQSDQEHLQGSTVNSTQYAAHRTQSGENSQWEPIPEENGVLIDAENGYEMETKMG